MLTAYTTAVSTIDECASGRHVLQLPGTRHRPERVLGAIGQSAIDQRGSARITRQLFEMAARTLTCAPRGVVTLWLRFERQGNMEIGTLEGSGVRVHTGDMFHGAVPTAEVLPLADLTWATPCTPSKLVGLWNNYRTAAARQGLAIPLEPLYFIKAASSYLAHGASLQAPRQYAGRVVYEGELGIVIGKRCSDVDATAAESHIFGYTCINDVTALDLITHDPAFAQWTRAKSFDGFGPFGPVIATGLDPSALTVRTLVNGRERQNYNTGDMIFSPAQIVSHLSRDLTLFPGDIIACGTSLGVGVLKPGSTVQVCVEGIGTLENRFVAEAAPAPTADALAR